MVAPQSRRALLRGAGVGLVGASGLWGLTGCGGASATPAPADAAAGPTLIASDVAILSQALELERRTVAAYVAAIPLLDHDNSRIGRAFLHEELEHIGELISLIKAAGSKARPRADSYPLGPAHDQAGALALLHALERLQIASYRQWLPRLSVAVTRAAVATIVSSDAQHIAVLRAARGEPALASAFVTGRE